MTTVPNVLSAIRLIASPLLLVLALTQHATAFLVLAFALLIDDWLDGKLAIWLRQQTTRGAQLDSAADATFYACTLGGLIWLKGELLRQEIAWIVAALASYAITSLAGLIKYRRMPSYHTRAAKVSWLFATVAVAALFFFSDKAAWPLRVAMLAVTATNVEATVMTILLPTWHADVSSLYHAVQMIRQARSAGAAVLDSRTGIRVPAPDPAHKSADH